MSGTRRAPDHRASARRASLVAVLATVIVLGVVPATAAKPRSPTTAPATDPGGRHLTSTHGTSAVAAGTTVAAINFQPPSATTPAGYTADSGAAFSVATGSGWEDLTGAPLSLVGNARERKVASDKRLDTFIHMQLPAGVSGVHTEGRWEIVLPNGTYTVDVGVGDPSYTDSTHVIRLEGSPVGRFVPSAGNSTTVFRASVPVTDGRLTIDAVGGRNTKLDFVDITSPGDADSTPPSVTVSPSGTTSSSGEFLGSATVTITATDASGVAGTSYSLNGGAAQTYDGPFTVSRVGSNTVAATATDAAGNVSDPVTRTFVVAQPPPAPTQLAVASDDGLGLGSRLVLSTIAGEARPGRAFTVKNTGTTPLVVSSITFSGAQPKDFTLDVGTPASFTLAPGASRPITVLFRPTVDAATTGASYVAQATLTINSDDPAQLHYQVSLGGLSSENYEGFREPDLRAVSDALGYSTDVVVTNKPVLHSIGPSTAALGDEVLAPYFTRVDASKPVTLLPVAHYSGRSASDSTNFGWFPKGSSSFTTLYRFPGGTSTGNANKGYGENQLLMPKQTSAVNTFDPTAAFGIFDGQGNRSDDALVPNGKWHNLRAYPARSADGTVVPSTWLIGDDIGSPQNNPAKNWDYQDYAFVLTNATPDPDSAQPTGGVLDRTLLFNGNDGGTGGTGFTTANGPVDLTKVSVSGGRLRIQTNSNTDDSHVNALALPVNAGSKLRVQARLVGPFDALDAGNEQQGIFFGPSATAYLKAEVEVVSGVRNLTIWRNDTKTIVARTPLPGGRATTLDLRMDFSTGDFSTSSSPYGDVYYAIDGGAFVKLNTALISLPSGYFRTTTFAGVVASHQGGGSPFAAQWEDFAAKRR